MKRMMKRGRTRGGFTLVEMLLVLVILATLAAIVVPKMAGRGQQAKITAAQNQISYMSTALDTFEVDNGYYPSTQEGLDVLIHEPSDAKNWRGPYMNSTDVPVDPWSNPYIYEYPGKYHDRGYDLSSAGPNGKAGDDDDINNWTDMNARQN